MDRPNIDRLLKTQRKVLGSQILIQIILGFYRAFISPVLTLLTGPGFGCRFIPTCSSYAEEAIQFHGWIKGGLHTLNRLSRCHPFCEAGYDPVCRDIG